MGAFLSFVVKSAFRNRRRAVLTASGVAVAIFVLTVLFAIVHTISATVARGGSEILLWVVDRYQAQHSLSQIPESYVREIQSIAGVEVVSPVLFSMSRYKTEQDLILIMGVDPETIRAARPFDVDEASWRAFASDPRAALVGGDLAKSYGLKVGDTITLLGMSGRGRENLAFTVRAIDRQAGGDPQLRDPHGRFTVHRRYLAQSIGREGIVTNIWLKVNSPAAAPRIAAEIDARFANYPLQTKTQSYKGFMLSMVKQMEGLQVAISLLTIAILIAVVVGTANSVAMAARERTAEVGTLKSLGFRKGHVLTVMLGESVLVALLGGGIGVGLAYGLLVLSGLKLPLEFSVVRGQIVLGPEAVAQALGVSVFIGLLGGLWPAVRAARLRVVDALREA